MSAVLQDTVTRHWDERAPSYRSNYDKEFSRPYVARRWSEVVAELMGPGTGLEVLDAGCGPGVLTRILVQSGHRVTAADVSAEMLEGARENLGADAARVSFRRGDASTVDLPRGSLDVVISRCVVWTLPRPGRAVRHWMRLLRPGGRLVIIDGNWYREYYASPWARVRARAGNFILRLRNGCGASQKLATHYAGDLPSTHVLRPDWDLGLLAGAGFHDLKVHRDLSARIYGRSWRRPRRSFGGMFAVRGTKPRDREEP